MGSMFSVNTNKKVWDSRYLSAIIIGILFLQYSECLYGHVKDARTCAFIVETPYWGNVGNNMKKVVLKKHIPLAEQLTFSKTVYVVRYNFELKDNITIPDSSILYFDGGTVSGDFTIRGGTFSLVGNGKYVGSVRGIFSTGDFKCSKCKFKYLSTDSKYFIDCRGACDIRDNEYIGFKSNVINLERCMGQCIVANNYIHDKDFSNAIDNERRAIHILHCGNVYVTNNIIDTYIGCGIGFITGDDTSDIYKSVVVSNNTIRNTRLGGITSMGNAFGNLYNAVIKGNKLYHINNGELKDYSALSAVINIHGGVNCIIEDNIIKECQGLGLDIEGAQRLNNSYIIRNNIFDGCRRLNFNLCDDIVFNGNKVSNVLPNPLKPGVIRIIKTLRFTMEGNDINDEDAIEATIQFGRNSARPAESVKTFFICKNNIFKVGNRINYIYDTNCMITVGGNKIFVNGGKGNGEWQYDIMYKENFKNLDDAQNGTY